MNPFRPLILSTACGYSPEVLAPFIESWRKHVPEADLAVVAGRLPEETSRYLDRAGVRIVPAELNTGYLVGWRKAWYRLLLAGGLRGFRWMHRTPWVGAELGRLFPSVSEASFHLFSQRFFHYRRYLDHYGWKYTHVLLTDLRDVLFQASPFPCQGLHVFSENEPIGTSHFTRRWFQLSYGSGTFRELTEKPLLCAGVTLGDTDSIRRYLDMNCSESLRVNTVNDVDQAVHNYIVHQKLVPAIIHPYGEGAAIHLNAVPLDSLRVEDGQLLDAHGSPYAVVHQYDRVQGLKLRGGSV